MLLLGFLWFQQYGLETTKTQVSSPVLPEAFDGFRVVQLSDLHGRRFGPGNCVLLAVVRAVKPDLIAVTGDVVDQWEQIQGTQRLLAALQEIAPVYLVTGNHEWSLDRPRQAQKALTQDGGRFLHNEAALWSRGGQHIVIAGVEDPCGPWDQPTPQTVGENVRRKWGQDSFLLLLGPRNETVAQWALTQADLVLAGHSHGGLIRLPGLGGVIRRHGDGSCQGGLYKAGRTQLFVSRGLGGKGLRLWNRPEIAVIELLKS